MPLSNPVGTQASRLHATSIDSRPRLPVRRFLLCFLALLVLCVLVLPARAQPGGLTGFSFLRLEPSARAAALGGAFSALYGDDVNGLFYNPALLNERMHRSLSLSYLNHVADLNMGFLAYGHHRDGWGSFGAGLRFLSWGELQGADENGTLTDTFGAADVALTLGFARALDDRLRYGINAHAILSSVDAYRASALAADLGVLYDLADQLLTLSASLHNLGVTTSSLGDRRDRLPLDLRLGLAKRLRYVPLLLTVTGYNLQAPGQDLPDGANALGAVMHHLTLGGEFQFSEAFNVRFGYNHRRHEALKTKSRLDLAGFGIGFGLRITRVRVDYALNSWSSFGRLHQFTVRTVL